MFEFNIVTVLGKKLSLSLFVLAFLCACFVLSHIIGLQDNSNIFKYMYSIESTEKVMFH